MINRLLNDKKICIIACIRKGNDEELISEISKLCIPEGFTVEYLGVTESVSMCAGYNEALEISDAKYKIYIRENTKFQRTDILYSMTEQFRISPEIGMIGAFGTDRLSTDMVTEHSILYGPAGKRSIPVDENYKEVVAITGDFMATQYDIKWDESNITDWYMYALSQCLSFRHSGYKIVVPGQMDGAWIEEQLEHNYDYSDETTEKCRRYALVNFSEEMDIKPYAIRCGIMSFEEISAEDFILPLIFAGIDFSVIELGISINSAKTEDYDLLNSYLLEHHLNAVISYNFSPLLSKVCNSLGVRYVSWVFDCPQQALFDEQVKNPVNYIFSFDKKQVETTKKCGGINVFHQPLAFTVATITEYDITADDTDRFSCQVSFIGSLYEDDIYEHVKEKLSDVALKDYEEAFRNAYGMWDGLDRITGSLAGSTIAEMQAMDSPDTVNNLKMNASDYYIGRILARDLANKERIELVSRLNKYGLRLFSGSSGAQLEGITVGPRLNSKTELPKAYYLSKINIGTTLHSITSGIPLRTFEVMGVGGFLLTNFQPEIPELFEIGKEIEVYKDFDEMEDKVKFYLENEEARKQIAINGCKAVRENYNIYKQLGKILEQAGLIF
ncbi:glycosyltransferase [Butyrivibrio sp. DSM 10294]|uniref:glycosyltransferase n=1 Tax=Butyrivibrio sp. DSM 10294 TaxID=2972457 RepID=UPI00234F11DE|nr:glycosyltransferase [Butyrivibrio sp. DSM 10294]MDC7293583.1 glycosyltransferase [Butyrivibrio sp. DSM 10294]